ncbi:MAG: flagellar brake protein [Gammaproteobacteria bacterium]|nr:flagellar brake protein [Gammaproteobacteria bacterium]
MHKPTLNLVVGSTLQIELPQAGSPTVAVTLIGYVPGRSIMVMLQSAAEPDARQPLRMGDPCVVRFEAGDHLYAFDTQVLCLAEQPFVHAHLAYPQGVQGTMVRRSQRVPVNDVVMMLVMEEAGRKMSVALADISLSGARLVAGSRLGEIGERFSIEIPHIGTVGTERVTLPCRVRYVREEQSVSAGGKRVYHHGVEFAELSRQALIFIERYIGDKVAEQRGIGA